MHPRWDGGFWAGGGEFGAGETKAQAEIVKVAAELLPPARNVGGGLGGEGELILGIPSPGGKENPGGRRVVSTGDPQGF